MEYFLVGPVKAFEDDVANTYKQKWLTSPYWYVYLLYFHEWYLVDPIPKIGTEENSSIKSKAPL